MKEDVLLQEVMEKWDELSQDPNLVMAYVQRRRQLIDEHAWKRDFEIQLEAEKAKVEAEKAKVREAEVKAHEAEARAHQAEAKIRTDMIRSMLQDGIDMEQIARITHCTMEEIKQAELLP